MSRAWNVSYSVTPPVSVTYSVTPPVSVTYSVTVQTNKEILETALDFYRSLYTEEPVDEASQDWLLSQLDNWGGGWGGVLPKILEQPFGTFHTVPHPQCQAPPASGNRTNGKDSRVRLRTSLATIASR